MIRREFLVTAGITVAAISIVGPVVWTDQQDARDAGAGSTGSRAAGWMHGVAGGCATRVGTEPPLPLMA